MNTEPRTLANAPAEPQAESRPVPVWLWGLTGALICWAAVFLVQNAAGFDPGVYRPFRSAKELAQAQPPVVESPFDKGRQIYAATCALCHQSNGLGDPAKAPPLAGSEWVQTPGAGRTIRIVLDGMSGPMTVKGQAWNLAMPPWKESFSDPQIAAVLSYIRNAWGNQAPAVTAEQVKAVREQEKERSSPWTAEELLNVTDN